jgi:hypothetical protein
VKSAAFCCFRCFRGCYLPLFFAVIPPRQSPKSEGFRGESGCRRFPSLYYQRYQRARGANPHRPTRALSSAVGFGHFEQELVVDLQEHAGLQAQVGDGGRDGHIARLMVSAAEPCRGALFAWRLDRSEGR